MTFVSGFILSNPFIVSSEELSYIKKQLVREGDELKIKQKSGSLLYRAQQGRYVCTYRVSYRGGDPGISPPPPPKKKMITFKVVSYDIFSQMFKTSLKFGLLAVLDPLWKLS